MDASTAINDLNASDTALRRKAAQWLAGHPEQATAAAVGLAKATGDSDEEVREWATAALEEVGAPAETDAPVLAEFLVVRDPAREDTSDTAYWSATLLGRLGANGARWVAALEQAVADSPHAAVRERAAWALGKVGPAAHGARATLQQAADSSSPRLARTARRALDQIGE